MCAYAHICIYMIYLSVLDVDIHVSRISVVMNDTRTNLHTHTHTHTHTPCTHSCVRAHDTRLVGSLKLQVSFAKETYKRDYILQKRPLSIHLLSLSYIFCLSRTHMHMGWPRLVGSIKLQVSFAEYSLSYRSLLHKRPIILRSILTVATPYVYTYMFCFSDVVSGEVGGWGRVPFLKKSMSPTPRRKWYLTTGRRAH